MQKNIYQLYNFKYFFLKRNFINYFLSIFKHKTLSKYLQSRVSKVDVKDTLKNTFHSLDEQLFEFEYEGCTATVVYIWNEGEKKYVQAANVGDSSAYL